MNFKLRNLVAATLAGSFLMGFGANAMADSTTDIVDALVAKGVMTDEEATLIKKGRTGEKEAQVAAAKKSEFDFINSDAPFKYDFKMGGHDADIQVYGIIDVGGATVNHSLPHATALPNQLYPYSGAASSNPNVQRQTAWIQGGLQDSRIGLKGGIDLFKTDDNKFKFIYQLEAGFNPLTAQLNNAAKTLADNATLSTTAIKQNTTVNADSSLNGEFFARQAWAGIDGGSLGKLSAGIQYNPVYEILGAYDPTSKADTFSPFGESGTIGGGGGISENARMKNSVKYANTFAGPMDGKVNAAVMYQFGNASGDTGHGYGATAQVGYENSLMGVQMAYDKFTDSIKAASGTAVNTLKAGLYNTDSFLVAVKATPTHDLKFSAGWEWYQYTPSTDSTLNYGTLFGYNVAGGVSNANGLGSANKQNNNIYFVGASFDFADRMPALAGLNTSLGYYATRFDASQLITGGDKANTQGAVDTWTFVADYKINKRFDTYFAYSNNHFSGDKYATTVSSSGVTTSYFNNVDIVGAGVRMKF